MIVIIHILCRHFRQYCCYVAKAFFDPRPGYHLDVSFSELHIKDHHPATPL